MTRAAEFFWTLDGGRVGPGARKSCWLTGSPWLGWTPPLLWGWGRLRLMKGPGRDVLCIIYFWKIVTLPQLKSCNESTKDELVVWQKNLKKNGGKHEKCGKCGNYVKRCDHFHGKPISKMRTTRKNINGKIRDYYLVSMGMNREFP